MAKRDSAGPVRVPLSPAVITELGGIKALPEKTGRRGPQGRWSAAYRIWTCYGHRGRGNANVGILSLTRTPARAGFALRVAQSLRNAEGITEHITAEVLCADDPLASPRRWTLTTSFTDPTGKPSAGLALREEARVVGDTLAVTSSGSANTRDGSRKLTSDWCLFEAVGRRPFSNAAPLEFDLLEGLSLLKRGHRLAYAGTVLANWAGRKLQLHKFHHFGHGVLPYEYWLDADHRLMLVVTGPRAYILDDLAAAPEAKGAKK